MGCAIIIWFIISLFLGILLAGESGGLVIGLLIFFVVPLLIFIIKIMSESASEKSSTNLSSHKPVTKNVTSEVVSYKPYSNNLILEEEVQKLVKDNTILEQENKNKENECPNEVNKKMIQGTYTEKLKTGGELFVDSDKWGINYYFPGPDARYNITYISISGSQIDKYIFAWKQNYLKYCELKKNIPAGGNFESEGIMNMTIRVGNYYDGVCLRSYHMPINTLDGISGVIADYEYGRNRSIQLMKILNEKR